MTPLLSIAFCLLVSPNALSDVSSKFDEYIEIPFSVERERLDNFAIQLKMSPGAIGWYFIFAGSKSCPGEARRRAIKAKNYIVKKHGIQAERVIWAVEGYREELTVELWVRARSRGKPAPTNPSLTGNERQISIDCTSKSYKQQRRIKLQGTPNNSLNRTRR